MNMCAICGAFKARDCRNPECPAYEPPETIAQRNARLNLTNWRPRAEDIP